MLRLRQVILALSAFACLSLEQFFFLPAAFAQTMQLPPMPAVNITPNPAPTTAPTSSTTPVLPASADVTKVKYYEFKSICLKPEEIKKPLSASVKTKRLALLQEKLKKSEADKNSKLTQQIKSLLIQEHLRQENYNLAEELFKKESANLSESEAVLLSADIDISKNLFRQAKDNLNAFLEKHPKNRDTLEKVAEVYILLQSYTEARMVYEDLSKINTKKDYTEDLCRTSSFDADHSNVEIYCGRLVKKYPKNFLGNIYLGISLRDQEKYKDAVTHFQTSLKIQPSEFASTCLAEVYFLTQEHSKAISQYEESIKIQPLSKRAHLGLANAFAKRSLFTEALEYYKKSCQLGLKPLTEMFTAASTLKSQKSNLTDSYFSEIQACKERPE